MLSKTPMRSRKVSDSNMLKTDILKQPQGTVMEQSDSSMLGNGCQLSSDNVDQALQILLACANAFLV